MATPTGGVATWKEPGGFLCACRNPTSWCILPTTTDPGSISSRGSRSPNLLSLRTPFRQSGRNTGPTCKRMALHRCCWGSSEAVLWGRIERVSGRTHCWASERERYRLYLLGLECRLGRYRRHFARRLVHAQSEQAPPVVLVNGYAGSTGTWR